MVGDFGLVDSVQEPMRVWRLGFPFAAELQGGFYAFPVVGHPEVRPGDMAVIGQPLDFLGINMYRRSVVAHGTDLPPVNIRKISPPGAYTDMGWEVYSRGLYDILTWVHRRYAPPAIYVTENGAAFDDEVAADGRCHDERRVSYLREHIRQALASREQGVPLRGYFVWSTMDNFEWAYGYKMRFGVIHVDYATQKRTIKDSGYLLQQITRTRAV